MHFREERTAISLYNDKMNEVSKITSRFPTKDVKEEGRQAFVKPIHPSTKDVKRIGRPYRSSPELLTVVRAKCLCRICQCLVNLGRT